ncbi:MAG: molybdenum cofactor biosynthesis protein B [Deltaproteobacteria bacterium]|jgi:molybdenum cofactor biosynthesis protein B|nr:molybdenum cofactor biosynthesis protein B [Gammaproteobacteria bacterium]MBP78674.1 molybdenum cofactor biosynthesis protein B [Deltaproteobacteria bacterium]|tara:strand:- start:61 stop:573 length:513 start_codon:yes stop_codon:yes gene_type:complete
MTAGKNNSVLLNISVVTVSDTRTQQTDESGSVLVKRVAEFGHKVYSKEIIPDDVYELRAVISRLIADPNVQAIILTGGTGFTERDNTQLAIEVLFDTHIDGFGELFRNLSYNEIGTSTIQSRAFAGLANGTIIFCLPGSPGACKTGWDKIIIDQLDSSHKPCNFVDKLRI